jgi:hypothetical protein
MFRKSFIRLQKISVPQRLHNLKGTYTTNRFLSEKIDDILSPSQAKQKEIKTKGIQPGKTHRWFKQASAEPFYSGGSLRGYQVVLDGRL